MRQIRGQRLRKLREKITPERIWVITACVSVILAITLGALGLRKIERLPLDLTPTQFDGNRAHQWMRDLSTGFPDRVTWSDSRKKAAVWLKDEFRKLGYEPKGMTFSETIGGKTHLDLENIYAIKEGRKFPNQIVVVAAHYDVAETTHEGAMDDASGVGVVLELARVFADEKPDRTILFLATDSEEFGAFWGARQFTRLFDRANQIVAVANFDFLAPEKQSAILTLCDGLKSGYTPLWLRELALDSLRSISSEKGDQGFEVVDFDNVMEFVERSILIPPADHGAFLAAGIPAFNWVGQTDRFAHQMTHYHHTKHDTADSMKPESFADYGRAAERFVRSVDALNAIPENFRESSYWKLTRDSYLDGWMVPILHFLIFLPFLTANLIRSGRILRSLSKREILKVFSSEGKSLAILTGALLAGYLVLQLLPLLRLIPTYEVFPATQKAPLLNAPNFAAILTVIGVVAIIHWGLQKVFYQSAAAQNSHPEVRQAFHGILILGVVIAAFAKNSYQALLFLLPPVALWMTFRPQLKAEDRLWNSFALFGGSLGLVAMLVAMGTVFHLGAIYWYVFLAVAYGLVSAYAVAIFFIAFAMLVRLFRTFVA